MGTWGLWGSGSKGSSVEELPVRVVPLRVCSAICSLMFDHCYHDHEHDDGSGLLAFLLLLPY